MGSLYLIRHGQASFGSDDYDVLSTNGQRQARLLGAHLASLGIRLDRCLSGTLRRQRHTAETMLDELATQGRPVPTLQSNPAFDEFDADGVIRGLLPGLLPQEPEALHILRDVASNKAEFQRLFARIIERWLDGGYDTDGLQSWRGFVDTVRSGLEALLDSAAAGEHIAVVTSGGTIAALLHLITGIAPTQAFEMNWQIVNTSLSHLRFRDRAVVLATFNEYPHLQLTGDRQLITYR